VPSRVNITDRDQSILDAIVRRVRVLSVAQIARTWFGATQDPVRFASRRLNELAASGFIERFDLHARPELNFELPIMCWAPGEAAPAFSRLSTRLAARWRQPVHRTPAVVATASAGIRLGGHGGRRPRRSEASHDLSLAALYLHIVKTEPRIARTWVSEAGMRRFGFGDKGRLPDALVHRNSRPTIIELGGTYSAAKLIEFHDFCKEQGLRYELW